MNKSIWITKIYSIQTSILLAFSIAFLSLSNFAQAQNWRQLLPTGSSPTTREFHTAVFDPTSNRMIVFGGADNTNLGSTLNDVWILTNANGLDTTTTSWIKLSPSGNIPPGRFGHTAVYDAINNRMTIFGGDNNVTVLHDVWVLSNANGLGGTPTWTMLSTVGFHPSSRYGHSAVYDNTNNRMIVFGGFDGKYQNDVWVLNNANGTDGIATWTKISTNSGAPAEREGHSAIYDAANNRMTIFGGLCSNDYTSYLNDVWVFSNANGLDTTTSSWTQLYTNGDLPAVRYGQTAVYNNINNQMIIFGGFNGYYQNDVWMFSNANGLDTILSAWIPLLPTMKYPSERYGHTVVYDTTNNQMIIFGGFNGSYLNDTWVANLSENGIWDNSYGTFDSASDTTYFAFESAPNVSAQPSITWLPTYLGHTGVLQLGYTNSSEGLKLTSFSRFTTNTNQPWYRIRVVYSCDSPCNGESILPLLLIYIYGSSQSIIELGASYTGNSLIQSGNWYTLDAYVNTHFNFGQLQVIMKNGGSSGAMYIDSIKLDNIAPPAISNPVYATISGVPLTTGNDTTYWGFENAPGETTGQPQVTWLPNFSLNDAQETNVIELDFYNPSDSLKMTSLPSYIPAGYNAVMSFNVNTQSPANISVAGFLYGIESVSPLVSDIAGYACSLGAIPIYATTPIYVPLNSVSLQSTFQLQIQVKKDDIAFNVQVWISDIQLFYSPIAGYDSSLFDVDKDKH